MASDMKAINSLEMDGNRSGSSSGRHVSDEKGAAMDSDAMKLTEMGYTPALSRNFSVWSVLGVGFSVTNSWYGISAGLVTGINSGGPVLVIYGIILICLISTCVGISLSELASAMPNAGGQYFWANELAPKRYADFASYVTGWFAWAGAVFTSASIALATGSAIVGCIQLFHPDITIEAWMVVVAYEIVNASMFIFNCYGKTLPAVAKAALWISLTSFLVILIVVPAKAPSHESATFVFANFVNNTGWSQNGIAFIVGLVNTNWAFACLDCATHLAEEVAKPERMVPIAIMGTVAIGFVTSWFFSVAMFFSMNDLDALFNTPTLVPILELFNQALQSRSGAVVLECFIILTGCGCQVASHTWQSRLCWSFARDRGLPAGRWLSKVHPVLDVPINAHFVSCVVVALLGLLYLGSYTALNSIITACIVLLYVSYAVPVLCLLIKGRDNIRHGPFWMGKVGLFANVVLLCWTVFTFVMYAFPPDMPVAPDNMNYVSAVYGVMVVIVVGYWFIRGKKTYRKRDERHEETGMIEEHTVPEIRIAGKSG